MVSTNLLSQMGKLKPREVKQLHQGTVDSVRARRRAQGFLAPSPLLKHCAGRCIPCPSIVIACPVQSGEERLAAHVADPGSQEVSTPAFCPSHPLPLLVQPYCDSSGESPSVDRAPASTFF